MNIADKPIRDEKSFDVCEADGKMIVSMNGALVASFETSHDGDVALNIFIRGILLDKNSSVWDVNRAKYITSVDKENK